MRPDLEALVAKWIEEPSDADELAPVGCTDAELADLVQRVAAHERARWAAKLRERAVEACSLTPQAVHGIDMLNAIADELEAER